MGRTGTGMTESGVGGVIEGVTEVVEKASFRQ